MNAEREADAPLHVRLDRCVPAARARANARDSWPRIDARGRLVIGGACSPRHAWWLHGGPALLACLDDICAPDEIRERYAELFHLPAAACVDAKLRMDYFDFDRAEPDPSPATNSPAGRSPDPPKPAPVPRCKARREARKEAEIDLFAEAAP